MNAISVVVSVDMTTYGRGDRGSASVDSLVNWIIRLGQAGLYPDMLRYAEKKKNEAEVGDGALKRRDRLECLPRLFFE